jgi:predicted Zn-dependent protease with MMP-like domain
MADLIAPSLDEFAVLAEQAWSQLPEAFRAAAGEVVFRVEDFADELTLTELGIDDPFELTGLYSGVSRRDQSVLAAPGEIPMVFLFRRPILDEWADRGDVGLGELILHVLVHEVGHHIGLSDSDMHVILESAD